VSQSNSRELPSESSENGAPAPVAQGYGVQSGALIEAGRAERDVSRLVFMSVTLRWATIVVATVYGFLSLMLMTTTVNSTTWMIWLGPVLAYLVVLVAIVDPDLAIERARRRAAQLHAIARAAR